MKSAVKLQAPTKLAVPLPQSDSWCIKLFVLLLQFINSPRMNNCIMNDLFLLICVEYRTCFVWKLLVCRPSEQWPVLCSYYNLLCFIINALAFNTEQEFWHNFSVIRDSVTLVTVTVMTKYDPWVHSHPLFPLKAKTGFILYSFDKCLFILFYDVILTTGATFVKMPLHCPLELSRL